VSTTETGSGANRLEIFRASRATANERIFEIGHLGINRFFSLDSACYRDGALPGTTKELLGLVASLVLRCDDCVTYHIDQCVAAGWSDDEIVDALNVGLVVGGSIVIPHVRRAIEMLDLVRAERAAARASSE
jgi:AhpD family alkylhydroperoxidase